MSDPPRGQSAAEYVTDAVAVIRRAELAAVERVCEESLTDPRGRGVRIDRAPNGGVGAVYLDAAVPFGVIHEHVGAAVTW